MPLTAGSRLGPYEILAAIGAGGMGERAFPGDDISITLAAVLKDNVALGELPTDLPSDWRVP